MVAQGVLPFQLDLERETTGLTALAGLPVYLELAEVAGLAKSIAARVCTDKADQGWTDEEMAISVVLLNLAGGECVDDIERLEADDGLRTLMKQVQWHGLPRRQRRLLMRRWRKSTERAFPSASALRSWLNWFHNDAEERKREPGVAFIPARVAALQGLMDVKADVLAFVQAHSVEPLATLDIDATLVATTKSEALWCYKGFAAYQPLNVWWAEQRMVVHSEFRDGNVPAGFEQLRILEESLAMLPPGVTQVRMRSDSAGYQWDLLKYCAEGRDERFGVIEFTVSADVTEAFRLALLETPDLTWHPVDESGEHEWAEVCFVPKEVARKKDGPNYRFFAIREPLRQLSLFDEDDDQLSFPTFTSRDASGRPGRYKLFALVTNREGDGGAIIRWHWGRCGDSEQVHAVMKRDLAGGKLPSKHFGANAAWWALMLLALNLDALMRRLVLGEQWARRRMKAMRLHLIHLAGRVVHHARQVVLRVSGDGYDLLADARRTIASLATVPGG